MTKCTFRHERERYFAFERLSDVQPTVVEAKQNSLPNEDLGNKGVKKSSSGMRSTRD